jgi:hypothetical protein
MPTLFLILPSGRGYHWKRPLAHNPLSLYNSTVIPILKDNVWYLLLQILLIWSLILAFKGFHHSPWKELPSNILSLSLFFSLTHTHLQYICWSKSFKNHILSYHCIISIALWHFIVSLKNWSHLIKLIVYPTLKVKTSLIHFPFYTLYSFFLAFFNTCYL